MTSHFHSKEQSEDHLDEIPRRNTQRAPSTEFSPWISREGSPEHLGPRSSQGPKGTPGAKGLTLRCVIAQSTACAVYRRAPLCYGKTNDTGASILFHSFCSSKLCISNPRHSSYLEPLAPSGEGSRQKVEFHWKLCIRKKNCSSVTPRPPYHLPCPIPNPPPPLAPDLGAWLV